MAGPKTWESPPDCGLPWSLLMQPCVESMAPGRGLSEASILGSGCVNSCWCRETHPRGSCLPQLPRGHVSCEGRTWTLPTAQESAGLLPFHVWTSPFPQLAASTSSLSKASPLPHCLGDSQVNLRSPHPSGRSSPGISSVWPCLPGKGTQVLSESMKQTQSVMHPKWSSLMRMSGPVSSPRWTRTPRNTTLRWGLTCAFMGSSAGVIIDVKTVYGFHGDPTGIQPTGTRPWGPTGEKRVGVAESHVHHSRSINTHERNFPFYIAYFGMSFSL